MRNNANLVCLVCTISQNDFEKYPDSLFLTNYFTCQFITRTKALRKNISIVPRSAVDTVTNTFEEKLNDLGIYDYSFNFSTDYLMEDV